MICVLDCGRDPHAPPVCDACRSRHRVDLQDLANLWPLLAVDVGRSITVSYEPRVTGTRTAGEPVRLEVIDLALPGAGGTVVDGHGDQYGEVPITSRLCSWVDWVAEQHGGRKPAPIVPAMCGWLYARSDWTADHFDGYAEMHAEVRVSVLAVRRVLQISRGIRYYPVPCPTCDVLALRQEQHDEYIVCANCSTALTAAELLERLPA